MSQSTFNAHMLIHNSVKSLGGCHHVKQAITADMRKAYVAASSARNRHLEKQKAKEITEARGLEYNHQRKRKTYAEMHKYKLGELAKQLATDATTSTNKRPVPPTPTRQRNRSTKNTSAAHKVITVACHTQNATCLPIEHWVQTQEKYEEQPSSKSDE